MLKYNAKHMEKVKANNACVERLKSLLTAEGIGSELELAFDENIIEQCTLKMFHSCKAELLKGFIGGRNPIKGKVPIKGTVDKAKNGEYNLVRLAFDCKHMKNEYALASKKPHSNKDLQRYGSGVIIQTFTAFVK